MVFGRNRNKGGSPSAQAQQGLPVPISLDAGDNVKVSTMARFSPENYATYFSELRSSRLLVVDEKDMDDWTQMLVSFIDKSIVLSKMKPFEIHPISDPSVYLRSFMNEVSMNTLNLRLNFRKRLDECQNLIRSLASMTVEQREEKRHQMDTCIKFFKNIIHLSMVGNVFIIEFVARKSQFSLPLGIMPNSAKGVVGIWTD